MGHNDDERELEGELAFLRAAEAYRDARRSGDAARIAEAERAWRDQVRAELQGGACDDART